MWYILKQKISCQSIRWKRSVSLLVNSHLLNLDCVLAVVVSRNIYYTSTELTTTLNTHTHTHIYYILIFVMFHIMYLYTANMRLIIWSEVKRYMILIFILLAVHHSFDIIMSCDVWTQQHVCIKHIFLITKIWADFTVCSIISSSISFLISILSIMSNLWNHGQVKYTNIQRTFRS